ncbi:hypothetical protein DFH06DRAFT_1352396 [Mycena polygramma]|nr:hypothetical protein DFH06DRAFT_1352396 [Mycena polygramma]
MPAPGPFLEPDSFEGRFERTEIEQAWRMRDRSGVTNYDQFLQQRGRMRARIACSKAIASRRSACYRPFHFRRWLHQHETGIQPDEDLFGGAPHLPGMWHSYRNPDGTWGPEGGIMDASRWAHRSSSASWTWNCPPLMRRPGHRDPDWDGVPVPKTPGKPKRRQQRRRDAARLLAVLADAQERAQGWGLGADPETPSGWGHEWRTEEEWDRILAEPRKAVSDALEALAPYYIV